MKRGRLLVLAVLILLLLRPALSVYTLIETAGDTSSGDIQILKVAKTPLGPGEPDTIIMAGHILSPAGTKDKAFIFFANEADPSTTVKALSNWDLEGRGYQFTDMEVLDLDGDDLKEIVVTANFNYNTTDPTNVTSQVIVFNRELAVVKQLNWTHDGRMTYATALHIADIEISSTTLEVLVGGYYLPEAADEKRPFLKILTKELALFDGSIPFTTWDENTTVTDLDVKNLYEEAIGTKEVVVALSNGDTSKVVILQRGLQDFQEIKSVTNPSWTDIRRVVASDIIDNDGPIGTEYGFKEIILGIQDQNVLVTDITKYSGTGTPLTPVTDIAPLSIATFGDLITGAVSSDEIELLAGGGKPGEGAKLVLLDKDLNELATRTWPGERVASIALGSNGDVLVGVLGDNNSTISLLQYPGEPNITISDIPASATADQDVDIKVKAGDALALKSAVFEHNATGEFQNVTKDLTGQSGLVDATFTIAQADLKAGAYISVRAWVINEGGRWDVTDNSTFQALGLNGTINVTVRPIEPITDRTAMIYADYKSKHTASCSGRLVYENGTEGPILEMLDGDKKQGSAYLSFSISGAGNITAKVNCSSDYDSVTNTTVFVRDLDPPTFDLAVSGNLTVNVTWSGAQ